MTKTRKPTDDLSGFLLVYKPVGMTSHDVVDIVRKKLGIRRVGHAGTLDPFATGLLLVAVGTKTKMLQTFLILPKTYRATLFLGATSTTDDVQGEITKTPHPVFPSQSTVENVLSSFLGEQEQTPPPYSAIKVGGVRAYTWARKGEHVELSPRRITISSLQLLAYTPPLCTFEAMVSSGTYIRALGRDIGKKLGIGAYVQALERTAIGPWQISHALSPTLVTPSQLLPSLDVPTEHA